MKKLVPLLFAFVLAACGSSVDGPGEGDIRDAIAIDLPPGIEIADLEVKVAQNKGDEIEPQWRTRSDVEFRLTEDFVQRVGNADGKAVVKVMKESGETISGVVYTMAEPIGEDWKIDIERVQMPDIRGRAASNFDDYVIENSDDHKAAIEADKAAEKEAEEEARAEAARQRSAMEAAAADTEAPAMEVAE